MKSLLRRICETPVLKRFRPRWILIFIAVGLGLKVAYNETYSILRFARWEIQSVNLTDLPEGDRYPAKFRANTFQHYSQRGLWDSQDLPPEFFAEPYSVGMQGTAQANGIKIVAVGDIMAHADVQLTAYVHRKDPSETSGGYDWIFRKVKGYISEADLTMGNLETPVAVSFEPSGYPFFNADPYILDALQKVGFDVLFTANNHALDQGQRGIEETGEEIDKRGITYLGTGAGGEGTREYVIMEVGGEVNARIALLNYTLCLNMNYKRFQVLNCLLKGHNVNLADIDVSRFLLSLPYRYLIRNVIPSAYDVDEEAFLERISENVQKAKEEGAELSIVYLHWGRQYHRMPSVKQRELALAMCLRGVDVVIGSGPHVIQPIEKVYTRGEEVIDQWEEGVKEHLIAYSLGNFVSQQRGLCKYGMILEFTVNKTKKGIQLLEVHPQVITTVSDKAEVLHRGYMRSIDTYQLEMAETELKSTMKLRS